MQVGNVWLVLDNRGSNVPLKGVTPAECLLLSHNDQALNEAKLQSHQVNAGKFPLHDLEIIGEAYAPYRDENLDQWVEDGRVFVLSKKEGEPGVWKDDTNKKPRTDAQEMRRLERKGYNKKMLGMAFPGLNPKLPATFSEIAGWRVEDQKVVDAKAPKVEAPKTEVPKEEKK